MEENKRKLVILPFDEREQKLIENCVNYAARNPAGLPGHNLMLIIAKYHNLLHYRLSDCVVTVQKDTD